MNNTQKQYNSFQYSEFIGEKGQLVFRADTYAELVNQCAQAGIILPIKQPQPIAQVPQQPITSTAQEHYCLEHNVMFEKKMGKFGEFWSHSLGKDPVTDKYVYCNEK